jgi:hypothetical protein
MFFRKQHAEQEGLQGENGARRRVTLRRWTEIVFPDVVQFDVGHQHWQITSALADRDLVPLNWGV